MSFHATRHTPQSPADFLAAHDSIFAVFDHHTQDSGNISYGVEIGHDRYFVTTAGLVDDDKPFDHASRAGVLRNAVRLAVSCDHSLHRKPFRGTDAQYETMLRACSDIPAARFQTVFEFRDDWLKTSYNFAKEVMYE